VSSRLAILLATVLVLAVGGCRNPGPARDQRARAQFFDPYPQNEPAPIVSEARPREYQKPFAEPLRNQLERWAQGRQQAGP